MVEPRQLGKFKLLRRVGAGGVGEVYEAVLQGAAGFAKRVALKLLLPHMRREPEIVAMFIDEARIASTLNHPNIVNVYEFGEINDTYYMAMEFVDGRDLRDYMVECWQAGKPFPLDAAIFVVRELCRGLNHIHSADRKIVHRDVSPKNIFVTPEGRVKLGDFGIAQAQGRLTRTAHGQMKGTLAYLAPEQPTGEEVTARTDVYAAGLVLFELVTGRRLIEGETEAQLLYAAINPPWVLPSSIRPDAEPLDAIIKRALERHPALRYPSAAHLANALERFVPLGSGVPPSLIALVTASNRRLTLPPTPGAGSKETAPPLGKETTPLRRPPSASLNERTRRLVGSIPSTRNRRPWILWSVMAALVALGAIVLWTMPWPSSVPSWSPVTHVSLDAGGLQEGLSRALDRAAPKPVDVPPEPETPKSPDAQDRDAGMTVGTTVDAASARSSARRKRHSRPRPAKRDLRPPEVTSATQPASSAEDPAVVLAASVSVTRGVLQRRLENTTAMAQARGLWPGDDTEFDRTVARARQQLAADESDQAGSTIQRAERQAASFVIDRAFVTQKMDRLNRAIRHARLSAEQREALAGQTQSIVRLVLEGHLTEASAQMSRLRRRLATAR